MFDVTTGSYDGTEMCELIGAYMLSLITSKFKDEVGLYHDDGLAVCKATLKEIEKNKKEVSNVFKSNGLKITIDANKKIVHFLDVTFDLTDESYKPYMKPNNKLSYVHRQSSHPPALLKNISLNINKRLTNISSSKEVFNESIAPYQQALKESGYDHKLTYNPEPTPRNKRKRKRDITWYNPPFNSNIKTNLGRKFLHIVDKCFQKNHPLYKIFNRHRNPSYRHTTNTFFQMQMQQHLNLTPATVEKSLIAHWKENAPKLTSSTKPQSPQRQQLKPTLD